MSVVRNQGNITTHQVVYVKLDVGMAYGLRSWRGVMMEIKWIRMDVVRSVKWKKDGNVR